MTAPWSPARSSMRQRCLRQYLLRYELDAAPSQPDDHARMSGRIIHEGLAAAFRARAEGKPIDATRPLMAGYFPVAEQAMREHGDYDKLSDIETMRIHGEVYWVLAAIPPPHPSAILGVEMTFRVEVHGEPVTGVVDYAVRTSAASVHVRDWKSGAVSHQPTLDPALPLYGWEARRLWPWATTITVGLYSTRTRHEVVEVLEPDSSHYLLARLALDAQEARAAATALTVNTVDALYPPRRGEHCRTCSVRSYCPLFRHVVGLPIRAGVDVAAERHRLDQALERRS